MLAFIASLVAHHNESSPGDAGGGRLSSYGRHRGRRLSKTRLALLDALLPKITISPPPSSPSPEVPINPWTLFPIRPQALWLEIGFGGGEHLAVQARRHPDVGIIGCEVFLNGIASALAHINAGSLVNVRLFINDARLLLPALPVSCLQRVFLLFPDPWPKKHHVRRRFITLSTLDHIARLLADGGELRIASDDVTYVRWISTLVSIHPAFYWSEYSSGNDWQKPPSDWVTTRYEIKALRAGRSPVYLRFVRRARNRIDR